jgi:Asp-tRNA(Asn)/Glu-tRNA(Gln) amidotransferase C subunit
MAFFGLTYLGPQSLFSVVSSNHSFIHVFEKEDIIKVWMSTFSNPNRLISKEDLQTVLKNLYNGPLPDMDKRMLETAFDDLFSENNLISLTQFESVFQKLKQNENLPHRSVTQSASNQEYRERLRKHVITKDFRDKQNAPLVSSHDYGWKKVESKQPLAKKPSSDITKFAQELVRNGIYY